MRVIHFSHNVNDGGGKSAYRLHKALRREGIDSIMLVYRKVCDDDTVIQVCNTHLMNIANPIKSNMDIVRRGIEFLFFILCQLYSKLLKHRWCVPAAFNFDIPYTSIRDLKKYIKNADIICLHSIQGFLSSRLIRDIYRFVKVPIVWTLMDIEPLTGGCYFNNGCERFAGLCGNCPQINKRKKRDISRLILEKKQKNLSSLPIIFVAPNSYCQGCILKSSLFKHNRIKKIFLGVDATIFKKIDKKQARRMLNLPEDAKIILFGCFNFNDKRKGADYLKKALKIMPDILPPNKDTLLDSTILLTFGNRNGFDFSNIPFKWVHLHELKDEISLALAYQATDIFVSPSIDDIGPMEINEAFVSGLPIVAFELGTAIDLVQQQELGYIAKKYDVKDFAVGISRYILAEDKNKITGNIDLKQICSLDFQAKQYCLLFKKLLSNNKAQKSLR